MELIHMVLLYTGISAVCLAAASCPALEGLGVSYGSGLACAGARLAKVVSFLLQLGCQGVGNPIATSGFDELQQSIGADLARLGLLKPFK